MDEKDLYDRLPKEKYRKVIVTESKIPKPMNLEGGRKVYQKVGIPYWFCKIKNNRDEFMYVYMEDLTEEDLFYEAKTGKIREFETAAQRYFRIDVLKALKNKPKEGYRWIPVYEPSIDEMGQLQFTSNEKPALEYNSLEWEKKILEYSPENESSICSRTTYFLLLLRWLKDGIVTLEQLTDDSSSIGHYRDSEDAKHRLELTGQRECGGLFGFVGNTSKILINYNCCSKYALAVGSYLDYGKWYVVSDVRNLDKNYNNRKYLALPELK